VPSKRYGNEMALSFYPKPSVEDEKWNNHFFIQRADANANTLILSCSHIVAAAVYVSVIKFYEPE
jgi:hypothetical protein